VIAEAKLHWAMFVGPALVFLFGLMTGGAKGIYIAIALILSIPDHGLSTVNADATSKRGNPHLFNKLAKVLRDQGKPHPPVVEEWGGGN
jgi:hypothetical protein